jgi:GntR family transcriptional regulator/MocR family aminotransferase
MPRSNYLPEPGEGPAGRALAAAIVADICRGRLRPGERLPGSRTLARSLDLARGTVSLVLQELEAEGWLYSVEGSGTFVREDLPPRTPEPQQARPLLGFDVPEGPSARTLREPRDVAFALLGGRPDLRLLPLDDLARAYRRVLRGRGRRLADYGPAGGSPRLIASLGDWLAETRGLRPSDGGLLVTRGSQQALFLVATALIRPGDRVGVEAFGYPPAWAALRSAGATLVPVPVDDDGACTDDLPTNLRALYLTPHHQYPTGAVLSPARRLRLLAQAAAHRVAILEDDYDHEYHYDGPPLAPLAAADPAGVVVSIGTLSKAFAPGLRVGWVVAPPPFIASLIHWRTLVDRQGDQVVEHAIAELIDDGTLARHLRRTRRLYAARRQALLRALAAHLPKVHPIPRPGGMALWCRVEDQDVEGWAARCREHGVHFDTARDYALDGAPSPFVRLGFAAYDEGELLQAVTAMAAAWTNVPPG